MNKEELIGKLQMVYVGDKNALNELIGYYDGLKEVVELLKKENQEYKEVIDKAIKLLGNYKHYSTPDEKQNSDNEDLVNNAFDILKEVE